MQTVMCQCKVDSESVIQLAEGSITDVQFSRVFFDQHMVGNDLYKKEKDCVLQLAVIM